MQEELLIPILRVGNTTEAAAWYRRLGFDLQFEHSRGPGLTRTDAVLTRGELRLILSEGDEEVRPDAVVCLQVTQIDSIAKEFKVEIQKRFLREQVDLRDPYGNRIRVVALDRFTPRIDPAADPSRE